MMARKVISATSGEGAGLMEGYVFIEEQPANRDDCTYSMAPSCSEECWRNVKLLKV